MTPVLVCKTTPEPEPAENPSAEERWMLINVYRREDAIREGILVPYRFRFNGKSIDCCFTSRLYEQYKQPPDSMKNIARIGMKRLAHPAPDDNAYRKIRVIVANQVWVVQDRYHLTFLEPQDY